MAKLSSANPLGYVINRSLNDKFVIKNKLFKERLAQAKNLYRKDLFAHYGCVNAIEFSAEGELLISGGDDRRVLLWSLPDAIHGKGAPIPMETNHISNIFCLAFDSKNSKIFSGGNDDQVIVHDLRIGSFVVKLLHKKPVYGLSVNPQSDFIIATAGDDGRILIFDIRESSTVDPLCVAKQKTGFHSVMFNPFNSRLLATANSEEGISLWDYRKPREALIRYDCTTGEVSGISVCFNSSGSRLLALRRRLPPVLYATQSQNAICQFYHPQYYNSCTMKTCCFAGDNDEYILSGSDDFNLYMWHVPKDSSEWGMPHVVLRGHRSIVNQVRYNKHSNLIASSGVEKMVKLWSTLPIGNWEGSLVKEHTETPRNVYSHEDYVYLVGHTEQRISHDYSDQSVQEDSRMMAFFDSLIQREIEGWDSPSEVTVTTDSDSDAQENNVVSIESLHLRKRWFDENCKKQKPNRITQLIAQKRKRLAKMAHHMSSSSVHKLNTKQNSRKRRSSTTFKNATHSNKFVKSNGTSKKTSLKKNHPLKVPLYIDRENRKHKLHVDKSEKITRSKKCKTRQSFQDISENSVSNSSIDAPSTSTGITSSSTVYRLVEQDSDEEALGNRCYEEGTHSEENFVTILPTPLNGSHDMCLRAIDITNRGNNGNVVALRNDYANVEVPSTSTLSNGKNNIAHTVCTNGLRGDKFIPGDVCDDVYVNSDAHVNQDSFINASDSSECEYDCTPVKKVLNTVISTPDSGFATGSCSSGYTKYNSKIHRPCSSRSLMGHCNDHTSDDSDYPYEQFRKRDKKARLNIRKKIYADSDSN
ncbi:hypothetical protein PPYR_03776 [Photinus pyralis]|uniref:Uncharacterized protein n=2 Tax=Photinus pyralis TaxID=7054 RepID=A0A1Y1MNG2_PHOPY|nr:DDB1- and CUL4-associated factor 5 [Photinus pyralis]KAB0801590.1 hypothetical protein PPYR_03776 [Photinus pyralis]